MCGHESPTLRGLQMHVGPKHPGHAVVDGKVVRVSVGEAVQPKQTVQGLDKPDGSETMPDTCQQCSTKDGTIVGLEKKVTDLEAKPVAMPTLAEFEAHAKSGSCNEGHDKQLAEHDKAVATATLEAVSDQFIRDKAVERGIVPDLITVEV